MLNMKLSRIFVRRRGKKLKRNHKIRNMSHIVLRRKKVGKDCMRMKIGMLFLMRLIRLYHFFRRSQSRKKSLKKYGQIIPLPMKLIPSPDFISTRRSSRRREVTTATKIAWNYFHHSMNLTVKFGNKINSDTTLNSVVC